MSSFVVNNTIFTGKLLFHEREMQSTNDFAKNLISKTNPIDGSVIITDAQTEGKGQGNNVWTAKKGENLTFSIIYHMSFLQAKHQFYLSMAVANGIFEALESLIQKEDILKIKWPNDIILNNKKIGGILIENTIVGQFLKYSIIGIGININQETFINLPNASSLKLMTNTTYNLNSILNLIANGIESQLLKLKAGQEETIMMKYNAVLYRYNSIIKYSKEKEIYHALVSGVNELGQLLVVENNKLLQYNYGEINWIYD